MKLFTKKGWSKKFKFSIEKPKKAMIESTCEQCGAPTLSVRKRKYCEICTNGRRTYAYYRDGKTFGGK